MERLNKSLSLYLIRHCSTKDSAEKRYSGKETSLNRSGIVEAHKLAKEFEKIGIKQIYSSPYKRALETAEIITNLCLCPLEIVDDLSEVNHGQWNGHTIKEVQKLWETEFVMRGKYPQSTPPPGGETLEQLQTRTLNAFRKMITTSNREKALVVTHGGNIHIIWMFLLNIELNDFWDFASKNKIGCGDIYLMNNAEKLFSERNSVSLTEISEY